MSPYTSIRDVVKELAGSLAQYLIADRFRNIDKIIKVNCHTLFLHGKQDKLIPLEHSIKLKEALEKKKVIFKICCNVKKKNMESINN